MAERYLEAELVLDDELLYDDAPRRSTLVRRGDERPEDIVREGEVLAGKYRVERIPGRNGLGVLVQVRHLELGQEVTLKFLVPEACAYPEFVQRFVREARAAVKIQGEHVARVTDVGRLESGAPYMVREYLRGPDLAEVLKVRGPLPVEEAVDYIVQACEGVAEGHALGVVHRNLRPTSLVVARRSDGTALVKVFDFAASESLHVNPFTERAVSLVGTSARRRRRPCASRCRRLCATPPPPLLRRRRPRPLRRCLRRSRGAPKAPPRRCRRAARCRVCRARGPCQKTSLPGRSSRSAAWSRWVGSRRVPRSRWCSRSVNNRLRLRPSRRLLRLHRPKSSPRRPPLWSSPLRLPAPPLAPRRLRLRFRSPPLRPLRPRQLSLRPRRLPQRPWRLSPSPPRSLPHPRRALSLLHPCRVARRRVKKRHPSRARPWPLPTRWLALAQPAAVCSTIRSERCCSRRLVTDTQCLHGARPGSGYVADRCFRRGVAFGRRCAPSWLASPRSR